MSSVDNRAVHMTFDNASFEKNLADTMKSMDALKKSLDFTNSKKSFADLGDHVKGFNLNSMASSVEGVSNKFIALGTIAITTLANITNRAVDAGINLAKSLTLEPVMDGFKEYETNINSIQTILANTESKGSTLEDVNGALDELNTYADQTIYNFSEMTRNIGTFTAAGVDLDTSVGAIKGIANLAAISGSNSQQASTAMYQLSQAIASGSVKLMDWNSVVNAGMGGEVFQKALFETGKAMGTITDVPLTQTFDEWKDAGNSFRGSLEKGWVTADVLTNTLQAFTGDLTTAQLTALGYTEDQAAEFLKLGQTGKDAATKVKTLTQLLGTVKEAVGSGWSSSFRIIFGDFNQAKETFSGFSDAIGKVVAASSKRRNDLLQGWSDLGGRAKLIEGIKNAFSGLSEILTAIKSAFHNVFPPKTAEDLYALTESFANFTAKLKLGQDGMDRVRRYASAFFTAFDIGFTIVKRFAQMIGDLFAHFVGGGGGDAALGFFDAFARTIQHLYNSLVAGGGIDAFFDSLTAKIISFGDALKNPKQFLQDFIGTIKDTFAQVADILLLGDFKGLGPFEEDSWVVDKLFAFRDTVIGIFTSIRDKIEDIINNLFGTDIHIEIPDGIKNFFKNLFGNVDDNTTNSIDIEGGFKRIGDALQLLGDIASGVKDAIGWVFDKITDLGSFVADAGAGIIDFFENLGPNINDFVMSPEFDKLLQFMQSLGVLMGGAGVGKIAKDGLGVNVDLTGGSLTNLGNFFKMISDLGPSVKANIEGLTGVFKSMSLEIKAKALLKIAEAIGLITASVLVLSFIDPEALAKSLTALSVGFGQLIAAMALLNTGAGPKSAVGSASTAASMIAIATAVLILSGAVTVMAQLDWEEIGKGLTGVTGLLIIMAGSAKLLQGSSASLISAGVGMTAMAVALTLLAGAMKIFATMTWEEIGKGLTAVAGGLLLMAGALQLMPASTILIGPGLVAVGFALTELGAALLIFATMSWSEIGKGMTVLAGGLLIIAAAMNLMPASTILTGPGLIAIATGLTILSGALKVFATMSWEEIGKSMTVLAGALLILAGAMALMQGGIAGAIAVGIMAGSLLILGKALKEFAKMSWKELGKGLAVIATALGALGLAALALSATGAIAAIFLLGIALVALGAGFALIGVGASLLAEAFQVMAAAGTAGIDVLMYAIDQFLIRLPEMARVFAESILNIADTLLTAAPGLVAKLGQLIGALLTVIKDNAAGFGLAATAWMLAILKSIKDVAPDLVKTGYAILVALLGGLKDNIKEITTTVATIIATFVSELAKKAPDLASAGLDLIIAFLKGLNDDNKVADMIEAGVKFLINIIEGITRDIDDLIDVAVDIIQALIDGIADNVDDLIVSGASMIVQLIVGITKSVNLLVTQGFLMVLSILRGIANNIVMFTNAAFDIVIALINGLADAIDKHRNELYQAGLNLALAIADGFTFGLASKGISVAKKTGGFFGGIVDAAKNRLDSNSPSMVFYALGEDVASGFILGLEANTQRVEDSASTLTDTFTTSFQSALAKTSEFMNNSGDFNPTITPVLDLTQVQAAAGGINGLLGDQQLTAGVSVQAANQLLAETTPSQNESPKEEPVRPLSFTQINNSPEALSTAVIYKRTRSQIEIAKKELENA